MARNSKQDRLLRLDEKLVPLFPSQSRMQSK